jgi:hypothetical protein
LWRAKAECAVNAIDHQRQPNSIETEFRINWPCVGRNSAYFFGWFFHSPIPIGNAPPKIIVNASLCRERNKKGWARNGNYSLVPSGDLEIFKNIIHAALPKLQAHPKISPISQSRLVIPAAIASVVRSVLWKTKL